MGVEEDLEDVEGEIEGRAGRTGAVGRRGYWGTSPSRRPSSEVAVFFSSFFRPSGPTQPRTLTRTTLPRCLIEFWEGGGEGTGAGVETESATRPSPPPPPWHLPDGFLGAFVFRHLQRSWSGFAPH